MKRTTHTPIKNTKLGGSGLKRKLKAEQHRKGRKANWSSIEAD